MIKTHLVKITKRIYITTILLGLSGVLLFSCKPQSIARLETTAVEDGWSYQILINDRLYIDQEYIPCVAGKQRFHSEKDALKTGRLVLKKLRDGEMPTLRIQELDSIGVIYR